MNIIPKPKQVEIYEGQFVIDIQTALIVSNQRQTNKFAIELKDFIKEKLGLNINLSLSAKRRIIFEHMATENAYELRVECDVIRIQAPDDQGLYYGMQTLKQLIVQFKRHIPQMYIQDKPLFNHRGFYHDVTRGKVPTLKMMQSLVDTMAFFKLNQLQLYVEHTFLFSGQSEVWTVTDPLTAEEIIQLDMYCRERYIELVPSITTFGHLYEALQTDSFKHLSESEKIDEFSFYDRMLHHTLNTTLDESIAFVKQMMDDFVPLFSSNKLNICADETFDLGEGRTKALAQKVGKSRLYVDFLNQIIEHARTYDKEIMFWGDMILEHSKCAKELPKDLVCLNWWYEPEYPEAKVKAITEYGFPQYMCPGVNGWNRFMNNHQMAYDNIKMMTDYGKKYDAIGILNTDWGDFGHWNFIYNSFPGLIYGAAFSWGDSRTIEQMNQAVNAMLYETNNDIMGLLMQLSDKHIMDFTSFVRWFEKDNDEYIKRINVSEEHVYTCNKDIEHIIHTLQDSMQGLDTQKRKHVNAFIVSAQGIQWMNMLYLLVRKDAQGIELEQDLDAWQLAERIEYWFLDFKQIWLMDNKPSELSRSTEFIRKITTWLRNNA